MPEPYRNSEADAMRKGAPGTHSVGKQESGFQYVMPQPKGRWLPAYSGGAGVQAMGVPDFEVDPEIGSAENEVGNDYDGDYDSNAPTPQM
jgi:hypothetical protein